MSCEGIKYIPEKTSFACGKLTEMTETYIFVFFRGLKRTATIYSLSFSPCGLYLACSSNTETIHVFKMDETSPKDMQVKSQMCCFFSVYFSELKATSIFCRGSDGINSSPPNSIGGGSGGIGFNSGSTTGSASTGAVGDGLGGVGNNPGRYDHGRNLIRLMVSSNLRSLEAG